MTRRLRRFGADSRATFESQWAWLLMAVPSERNRGSSRLMDYVLVSIASKNHWPRGDQGLAVTCLGYLKQGP
jgi:hypothetical protein